MLKADKYNPVRMFFKYIELIYEVDDLWEEFQRYLRDIMPNRRSLEYYEHKRDPHSIDIWKQMRENMGGGWPTITFAAASYILLKYQALGHDLDKELKKAHKSTINHIASDMLNEAKKKPEGAKQSTVSLLKSAGYEVQLHESELSDLHEALFKAAKESGLALEMSKHEGLPYNLEFCIKHGG